MSKIHLDNKYFTSDTWHTKYNWLSEKNMEQYHINITSLEQLQSEFEIVEENSKYRVNKWKNPNNLPFAWITTNGFINDKFLCFSETAFNSGNIVIAYDHTGNYNGYFASSTWDKPPYPTPKLPTHTNYTLQWIYSECKNMKETPTYSAKGSKSNSGMFAGCFSLKKINIYDFDKTFSLNDSSKLSREELVKLFKTGLLSTNGMTLTLGTTLLNKLTDEDKKIATDKGWTLA